MQLKIQHQHPCLQPKEQKTLMQLETGRHIPRKNNRKTKLETTETQTKIVEQKQNMTKPLLRVDTQSLTILASPTTQKRRKAKPGTPLPPHQIPFEEKDYSPPKVETDPVRPASQPVHKYLTRHLKMAKESLQCCGYSSHCISQTANTRGNDRTPVSKYSG